MFSSMLDTTNIPKISSSINLTPQLPTLRLLHFQYFTPYCSSPVCPGHLALCTPEVPTYLITCHLDPVISYHSLYLRDVCIMGLTHQLFFLFKIKTLSLWLYSHPKTVCSNKETKYYYTAHTKILPIFNCCTFKSN